jgi:hypothetical protein
MTDVRVNVSCLFDVLNVKELDNPYAQPVSGVLNKTGMAK